MTYQNLLQAIDAKLDLTIDNLTSEFGNEGADIGDAGNAMELIGNAIGDDHESYTAEEFIANLAKTLELPKSEIQTAWDEMKSWDNKQWHDAFKTYDAYPGFRG
jgi:hypothetical protein